MATINVAAAASTENGLPQAIEDFEDVNNDKVNVTFDGSYTLANQIVYPLNNTYDVYLSASDGEDEFGMGKVVLANKVYPQPAPSPAPYPVDFIANNLVLIKNAAWVNYSGSPSLPTVESFADVNNVKFPLSASSPNRHVWIANRDLAPAGMYANEALNLTSLGSWDDLVAKAIADGTLGSNVQTTLDGCINDPVPAVGIVYWSDYYSAINASPAANITFVAYAPKTVNETIIYSAAVLTNAETHGVVSTAVDFVNFLLANPSYFTAKGFRLLTDEAEGD